MSFGHSNLLVFLAAIVAGWVLLTFAPVSLATLIGLPFLRLIGLIVILIFALVIIYIGLRVLFRGGWRC
jgi:dolichyl-phosphate-mannose--protein O-mannosyl transferase